MNKKRKVFVYENGEFVDSPQDMYNKGFNNAIEEYNNILSSVIAEEVVEASKEMTSILSNQFNDCILYIADNYVEEDPELAQEIIDLAREYFNGIY